jgi:diacylglycerol kinase family enzyme
METISRSFVVCVIFGAFAKNKNLPKLDVMADGVGLGNDPVTIKVIRDALRVITIEKIQ